MVLLLYETIRLNYIINFMEINGQIYL